MLRIYLDTCCLNKPYDDQSLMRNSLEAQAKLHIQSLIKEGRIQLATSYILLYENSKNPFIMRKMVISDFLKKYSCQYISSDNAAKIQECAETIMNSGIKAKDALHVACAIEAGCRYLLSTDDRLLKYKHESILLLNPIDFICMEIEKQ